jgi:hypothetical protein
MNLPIRETEPPGLMVAQFYIADNVNLGSVNERYNHVFLRTGGMELLLFQCENAG